jgi:hypothetical protein
VRVLLGSLNLQQRGAGVLVATSQAIVLSLAFTSLLAYITSKAPFCGWESEFPIKPRPEVNPCTFLTVGLDRPREVGCGQKDNDSYIES